MDHTKKILIVEDDESLRNAIHTYLEKRTDYEMDLAKDFDSAMERLHNGAYNVVLSDIKMPGGTGHDLFEYVKNERPQTQFIYMTGYGSVEDAVKTMKDGAYDFIVKPFQLTTLSKILKASITDQEHMTPGKVYSKNDQFQDGKVAFITQSPKMLNIIENLKRVANSKATVLIQGESGTGKEVLSQMIHQSSPRKDKPFVAINCAALPDNLLESELFGHEKGSFTGAVQRQIGKFEFADGGTILLDEISEMSINMQTKLLRVLQECEIYRIGGNKSIPLNIRVIAATNRDLYNYMKEGHFREDLYYRINVIPIKVPPLRDRGKDVITIADHFLEEFAKSHRCEPLVMDELARYKVLNHAWQGNVRELRNAMERATLVGNFDQIGGEEKNTKTPATPDHQIQNITQSGLNNQSNVSDEISDMDDMLSGSLPLKEIEKKVIFMTLNRCNGNRTRAAEKLGISLRTLRNKLKLYREQEQEMFEN